MLNVVCVLKAGPEYKASHVAALRRGVTANLSTPHRFVCLSDMDLDGDTIGLQHGWQGWWSKLELFRPRLFDGPVLYFDLDTIIVGSLDAIAETRHFTMLENFWRPDRVGSGMMAWEGDLSHIYHQFARSPEAYMREYTIPDKWGDQAFILKHTPVAPDRFQHKYPGQVVSWKQHCVNRGGVPPGASVVCFHGQPRPWASPLWRDAA